MMKFSVVFRKTEQSFPIKFENVQTATLREGVQYYEGEYVITPSVEGQVVPTADKFLKHDMTVEAIPFFNVSNPAGGNTIYIGNEV